MRNALLAILVFLFSYSAQAQCAAGFTFTTSGLNVTFTNTSTPVTVPSTQYLSKNLNFGSGWYSFFTSINHTFPGPGTYQVVCDITVYDSLTQAVICTDRDTQQVTVNGSPCAVSLSTIKNGNTVVFTANNLSSTPGMSYFWDFGDGNTGSGSPITHTYTTTGYYHVLLVGSSTSANCSTSDSGLVIITPVQNIISGAILADSNSMDTFKVWLITYDSSSQILTAIDSAIISNGFTQIPVYTFNNIPAGQYRTKAAQLDGPTTGTGYIPTYHATSLYWNSATIINHSGSATTGKNIYMQLGTVTSGPGFIGGNVTMGANKGTAAGDPVAGMQIMLRDNASNAIKYTYTNTNGEYSFNNLPTGLYSVYPEEIGYTTTSSPIILTPNQTMANAVSFEKSENKKTVTPKSTDINDATANNLFYVLPNPSNGVISINWATGTKGSADVTVTDIAGRKVYQGEVKTGSTTPLNLNQLQAGMYFISIHANGQSATKQIVIQK
jgi:plastocyanin